MITTIARQQIVVLTRQRVFIAALAIMFAMTAAAGLIGWSSHRTIVGVYEQAQILLRERQEPIPPNPFALRPELALLSNMVIYIPLIGSLLAILLGHLSIADDESSGVGRLVFSRPVHRRAYVAGKIVAAAVVIAAILALSVVISALSLWVVNGAAPSGTQFGRLVGFYSVSWLYMMVFVVVGMLTMLLTSRRPLALLSALGVWLVVTFVLPQFTSGLRPTASLNPIVGPVSTSQRFFQVTAYLRPASIVEQYKALSAQLLVTAPPESAVHMFGRLAALGMAFLVVATIATLSISHHDFSKGVNHD